MTTIQEPSGSEDSLAPVALDRLTIEEEVAFMNRGKGKQLLSIALVLGVLGVGGASVMKALDRQQGERERARAVAELRQEHVDAYLKCVAPSTAAGTLTTSDRIHGVLENVVERAQKAAGAPLARCAAGLHELAPTLARANVAEPLKPALRELSVSASELTRAAGALAAYLQDPDTAYDFVQATALIDHVARAVTAYRDRDAAFRTKLSDL